jgi:dihydrodipicolinate synthase/N-acetylneuraminate lyase
MGHMDTSWSGIFPSLPTPFSDGGDLDLDSQRSIVRFAIESGSHGIICFGLAGEVFRLTADERLELLAAIVDEAGGRVPVLAGVGMEAEHTSIRLAKAAADAGADGIVIPPPITCPAAQSELVRYFERVAGAVDVPVMIQDAPEYLNIEVGPKVVETLADRIPNLAALKLEVGGDGLAEWVEAFEDRLPLFCGNGGLYLIDCLTHGAAGVAPGTDVVDLLVEIYELWRTDQRAEAWQRMQPLVPMLAFQMQNIDHYNATAKHVLHRRGKLTSPELRAPALRLNAAGEAIVDRYLLQLELASASEATSA